MTWNYRVMRHVFDVPDGETETQYAIHEVYYDESGKVTNWTKDATSFFSETADFAWLLSALGDAVKKPTLDYKTGLEITDA